MTASAAVRLARRRAGLSLRALARRAHTSHATLVAYEAGSKVPRVDTLVRILRAAGFTADLELSAGVENGDPRARGRELVQALEVAEQFPARHEPMLTYPPFAPVA
ncbi:MAG: helix-turn-helix domain-containing protein [Acidimicrobiia bacterium]